MVPGRFAEVAAVQVDVVGAGRQHHVHDRLGDDVTRSQVGQRMLAGHETVTGRIDQERALAAHGL